MADRYTSGYGSSRSSFSSAYGRTDRSSAGDYGSSRARTRDYLSQSSQGPAGRKTGRSFASDVLANRSSRAKRYTDYPAVQDYSSMSLYDRYASPHLPQAPPTFGISELPELDSYDTSDVKSRFPLCDKRMDRSYMSPVESLEGSEAGTVNGMHSAEEGETCSSNVSEVGDSPAEAPLTNGDTGPGELNGHNNDAGSRAGGYRSSRRSILDEDVRLLHVPSMDDDEPKASKYLEIINRIKANHDLGTSAFLTDTRSKFRDYLARKNSDIEGSGLPCEVQVGEAGTGHSNGDVSDDAGTHPLRNASESILNGNPEVSCSYLSSRFAQLDENSVYGGVTVASALQLAKEKKMAELREATSPVDTQAYCQAILDRIRNDIASGSRPTHPQSSPLPSIHDNDDSEVNSYFSGGTVEAEEENESESHSPFRRSSWSRMDSVTSPEIPSHRRFSYSTIQDADGAIDFPRLRKSSYTNIYDNAFDGSAETTKDALVLDNSGSSEREMLQLPKSESAAVPQDFRIGSTSRSRTLGLSRMFEMAASEETSFESSHIENRSNLFENTEASPAPECLPEDLGLSRRFEMAASEEKSFESSHIEHGSNLFENTEASPAPECLPEDQPPAPLINSESCSRNVSTDSDPSLLTPDLNVTDIRFTSQVTALGDALDTTHDTIGVDMSSDQIEDVQNQDQSKSETENEAYTTMNEVESIPDDIMNGDVPSDTTRSSPDMLTFENLDDITSDSVFDDTGTENDDDQSSIMSGSISGRETPRMHGDPYRGDIPRRRSDPAYGNIRKALRKSTSTPHVNKRKKQQRQKKDSEASSQDGDASGMGSKVGSSSDISVTSSRASRLSKDAVDAKPISDAALKKKLRSASAPGTRVTPRDQRILELMLAKREGEKKLQREKEAARKNWDNQKSRDLAARLSMDVQRRRSLSESRKTPKTLSQHGSTRSLADSADLNADQKLSSTRSLMDIRSNPRLRKMRELEDARRAQEDALKQGEKQWSDQSRKLLLEKEQKIKERRLQSMERKKSQEERLILHHKEMEEFHHEVINRQSKELKRAQSLKETKEQEIQMQRKLRNYYAQMKHQERLEAIKKKEEEEKKKLKKSLDKKSKVATSKIEIQQQRREKAILKSRVDLETKIDLSRKNQKKLEEELATWHRDLDGYRRMMGQKVEAQARLKTEERRRKALEDRILREKQQRDNMTKLLEKEEEWKADVEASIAMKDARSKIIAMEKEEAISELRNLAQASQRLRDELRQAYSTDKIHQMSQKAQMEATIGDGVNAATKNMSTLTLG